jgi:hypothetical protein
MPQVQKEELVEVGGLLAEVLWLDAVLGLLCLVVEEIFCIPNRVYINVYTM